MVDVGREAEAVVEVAEEPATGVAHSTIGGVSVLRMLKTGPREHGHPIKEGLHSIPTGVEAAVASPSTTTRSPSLTMASLTDPCRETSEEKYQHPLLLLRHQQGVQRGLYPPFSGQQEGSQALHLLPGK